MSKQILAFHGKESLKEEVLTRMQAHIDADQLIQGEGWDEALTEYNRLKKELRV